MNQPVHKIAAGAVIALGAALLFASSACTVSVTPTCGPGLVDCGNSCADLSNDDNNCGGCGLACPGGTFCNGAACVTGSCTADNGQCAGDGECCSGFCASDGACGCILSSDTSTVCSLDIDCCSNSCDFASGLCN